jgi:hypothetical protein
MFFRSGIIPRAAVELDAIALLPGDDPDAVVLDFMQPLVSRGGAWGCGGKAGRDEAGREGERTR